MNSNAMNNHNTNMLDGFERWFFGDEPGLQDGAPAPTVTEPAPLSIDQNDALIPAFSHRCDCGQHFSLVACIRDAGQQASRQDEADVLAPLHF